MGLTGMLEAEVDGSNCANNRPQGQRCWNTQYVRKRGILDSALETPPAVLVAPVDIRVVGT